MKKREIILFIIVFNLVLMPFISASFEIGNLSHSIDNQYALNDTIRGWINISLTEEPINSLFEGNFGGSISLIDLLVLNDANYGCTPNCGLVYETNNSEESKQFILNNEEEEIVGFKLTGEVTSVDDVSFDITSNASSSCNNQLKIDVLNDNIIDFINNKSSTETCGNPYYQCFNPTKQTDEFEIKDDHRYCQEISLPEAAGFRVGAWIKGTGSREAKMNVYDTSWDSIGECTLGEISSTTGETVSCDINKSIDEDNYYICVSSPGNGDSGYFVEGYAGENPCGFYDYPPATAAYNIFVQKREFDSFGTLSIDNKLQNGNNLNILIQEYLVEKYGNGNIDCSQGCAVPMKFVSNINNQKINLENLQLEYTTTSGPLTKTSFWDLTATSGKVNADFQQLYLDKANFSVPDDFEKKEFILTLEDSEIFSEKISTEKISQITSLNPKIIIAGYPTEFTVGVETYNSSNIVNYEWKFGNETLETTAENKITYTYDNVETFDLKITITDSQGFSSSKSFSIEATNPKDAVNNILNKKLKNFNNVKEQIESLPSFQKNSLSSILDLTEIENSLISLQQKNSSASTDEDYVKIMRDLVTLKVPESVTKSESAEGIPFYPSEEIVNPDAVKEITEKDYDEKNKNKYIEAILVWEIENINIKVDYDKFDAIYEDTTESILNIFKIQIDENSERGNSYFIIDKLENINLDKDFSETENFYYIELSGEAETIEFSTTEDVSFSDLPAFISPSLNKLSVDGEGIDGQENSGLIIFVLIIFLLMIVAFVVYIILQEWYKRKYEDYLFKNKNDLYNIVSYMQNSKKKEMQDDEISKNLKKAGWKSEQIRYILRKYSGKRTGMFEIPVKKIFDRIKKKSFKEESKNKNKFQRRKL